MAEVECYRRKAPTMKFWPEVSQLRVSILQRLYCFHCWLCLPRPRGIKSLGDSETPMVS